MFLKNLGQRGLSLCLSEHLPVVVDFQLVRRLAVEQRSMGRESYRDQSVAVLISYSLAGKRIDVWCLCLFRIVSADVVRSLCIQGYQYNIFR